MPGTLTLKAREQHLLGRFYEALLSSLDPKELLTRAFPVLSELIPIDHGALCLSRPEAPGGYDWATDLPPAFFAGYPEMAPHDFVREAVRAQPNVALRDSEMISRRDLEANFMYDRSRELGLPLEHVMSVMLPVHPTGHGGVTLYRAGPRPFSDHHRDILQLITQPLADTMHKCWLFGAVTQREAMLEALRRFHGSEVIAFDPSAREVERTATAAALLDRWFPMTGRGPGDVPFELLSRLAEAMKNARPGAPSPEPYVRSRTAAGLQVSFVPFPCGQSTRWMLVLDEVPYMPKAWIKLLTYREIEVVSKVLLGRPNELIAQELGCAEGTVKKHLQHVFDKLGVPSRSALIHLANTKK